MNTFKASRRRFIGIMAAGAVTSGTVAASVWPKRRAYAAPPPAVVSWRGIALGADAALRIHHPDRAFAQALIDRSIAEVHRLEQVFSLYQDDSALVRLNRDGRLDDAPLDLLRLLQEAQSFSRLTDGAFDPTVQPLWKLYADAVVAGRKAVSAAGRTGPGRAEADAVTAGSTVFGRRSAMPSAADIRRVLSLVDYRAIEIDGRSVRLARPGMALTLNGIAQGYITDRVTELLKEAGMVHVLVDMGEIRGLNGGPGNRPWRVGLAGDSEDRKPLRIIDLRDRAISTSSGHGTIFDADGAITHLFDPHTGNPKPRYRSVSVMANDATTADALSTAFSLMDESAIKRITAQLKLRTWVLRDGETQLSALS